MSKRALRPLSERIAGKFYVDAETGCHVWTGSKSRAGYGIIRTAGKRTNAHRLTYEASRGEIPAGFHVDHLCRNRACINPEHLEAVTPRENTLRGEGPSAKAAQRTHCDNGHELVFPNLIVRPNGHRRCRTCRGNAPRKFHTVETRDLVIGLRAEGASYLTIQKRTGISRGVAWSIANGRSRIVEA